MLAPGNFGCLGLRRGAYWVEQSKASAPPPEGPQEVARGDGGDGAAGGVPTFLALLKLWVNICDLYDIYSGGPLLSNVA